MRMRIYRLASSVGIRSYPRNHFSMATTTPASQQPVGPLEMAIREKLSAHFTPTVLKITNDSARHRFHAAMRAQGTDGTGETHFSVQIVSAAFLAKTTMQRHRLVYATLKDELDAGLHSLSLQTKTEEEYAVLNGKET